MQETKKSSGIIKRNTIKYYWIKSMQLSNKNLEKIHVILNFLIKIWNSGRKWKSLEEISKKLVQFLRKSCSDFQSSFKGKGNENWSSSLYKLLFRNHLMDDIWCLYAIIWRYAETSIYYNYLQINRNWKNKLKEEEIKSMFNNNNNIQKILFIVPQWKEL